MHQRMWPLPHDKAATEQPEQERSGHERQPRQGSAAGAETLLSTRALSNAAWPCKNAVYLPRQAALVDEDVLSTVSGHTGTSLQAIQRPMQESNYAEPFAGQHALS